MMSDPVDRPNTAGAEGVPAILGKSLGDLEPLFAPSEVAEYLKMDPTTVRRLFLGRDDVVKLGRTRGRGGRRSYVTLRIPLSAVRKFLAENR